MSVDRKSTMAISAAASIGRDLALTSAASLWVVNAYQLGDPWVVYCCRSLHGGGRSWAIDALSGRPGSQFSRSPRSTCAVAPPPAHPQHSAPRHPGLGDGRGIMKRERRGWLAASTYHHQRFTLGGALGSKRVHVVATKCTGPSVPPSLRRCCLGAMALAVRHPKRASWADHQS